MSVFCEPRYAGAKTESPGRAAEKAFRLPGMRVKLSMTEALKARNSEAWGASPSYFATNPGFRPVPALHPGLCCFAPSALG